MTPIAGRIPRTVRNFVIKKERGRWHLSFPIVLLLDGSTLLRFERIGNNYAKFGRTPGELHADFLEVIRAGRN